MKLTFTRDQRRRLFNWRDPNVTMPTIALPVGYEVERGREHRLSPYVSVRELEVMRLRDGTRALRYELVDVRDDPRILRRLPPAHIEEGDEARSSVEMDARAAEESAYYAGFDSMDAGEGVPRRDAERFASDAERNSRQSDELNRARRERYELDQRIRRAREDAALRGVDISSPLRVIERQLEKIERRVYEGKAA